MAASTDRLARPPLWPRKSRRLADAVPQAKLHHLGGIDDRPAADSDQQVGTSGPAPPRRPRSRIARGPWAATPANLPAWRPPRAAAMPAICGVCGQRPVGDQEDAPAVEAVCLLAHRRCRRLAVDDPVP